MKTKGVAVVLFAVLLLSMFFQVKPVKADLQVFGDDFEDPLKTASQWTVVDKSSGLPGLWEIRHDDDSAGVGILHASKSQGGPAPMSGVLYRMNLPPMGDFVVEFDVKWKGGPWFQYGLLFRGVPGNEFAQGYMTYMSKYDNTLRLIKLDPSILSDPYWGAGGTALSIASFAPALETWYHFEISAIGSTIKISVNNVLLISSTDITYSSGAIGLINWHSGLDHAHFDNVLVSVSPNGYAFNWLPPLSLDKAAYKAGSTIPIKFTVKYNDIFVHDETVQVKVIGPSPSTSVVFSAVYGVGGDQYVRINDLDQLYVVNWHLENTIPGEEYTIEVWFGATLVNSIVLIVK